MCAAPRGEAAAKTIPPRHVRVAAAVIFGLTGAWVLAPAFLKPGISF